MTYASLQLTSRTLNAHPTDLPIGVTKELILRADGDSPRPMALYNQSAVSKIISTLARRGGGFDGRSQS